MLSCHRRTHRSINHHQLPLEPHGCGIEPDWGSCVHGDDEVEAQDVDIEQWTHQDEVVVYRTKVDVVLVTVQEGVPPAACVGGGAWLPVVVATQEFAPAEDGSALVGKSEYRQK